MGDHAAVGQVIIVRSVAFVALGALIEFSEIYVSIFPLASLIKMFCPQITNIDFIVAFCLEFQSEPNGIFVCVLNVVK